MRQITVSAVYVEWPLVCASCCRKTDKDQRATITQTTGKRVIRTTHKFFDYPYCSCCARYWDIFDSLTPSKQKLNDLNRDIRRARRYENELPSLSSRDISTVVFVGIITLGIMAYPVYYWLRLLHEQKYQAIVDALPKLLKDRHAILDRIEDAKREQERLLPEGGKIYRNPVEYAETKGTLHVFVFANDRYADLFAKQNAKKIR